MKQIENWFTIEPIKGYVIKKDYEIINNLLSEQLADKYKIFKKQKFILVIVVGKSMTTYDLVKILINYKSYSKTYDIEKIANESRFLKPSKFKRTIGITY